MINVNSCIVCGKCTKYCPAAAIEVDTVENLYDNKERKAVIYEDVCLGCGVCARVCPKKAISLIPRPQRVITPVNSTHKVVLMAIERGKLQDLIFDNQAYQSHRAMAAILCVILKLPLIKQVMASKQMKSRYLDVIIKKLSK